MPVIFSEVLEHLGFVVPVRRDGKLITYLFLDIDKESFGYRYGINLSIIAGYMVNTIEDEVYKLTDLDLTEAEETLLRRNGVWH